MRKLFIFLLIFIGSFLIFSFALAALEGQVVLRKDEVHEGLYFASGNTVIIEGIINGDAYIGANQVIINGAINGDLFVGGSSVLINGRISDDLRVAGSDITINGQIGKNVSFLGQSVLFSGDSDVTGSVLGGGQSISLLGLVGREIKLAAKNITLNGFVGSNVNVYADSLVVQQASKVKGSLVAFVEEDKLFIADENSIEGSVEQKTPVVAENQRGIARFNLIFNGWVYLSLLFLGIITVLVLPRQVEAIKSLIIERPWWSLGWGLIWAIAVPIVVFLLFVSLVGVIPGVFVVFVYIISLVLAQVFAALLIGHFFAGLILKRQLHKIWQLVLGLLFYQLLIISPFLGSIVLIVGTLLALGAVTQLLGFGIKKLQQR